MKTFAAVIVVMVNSSIYIRSLKSKGCIIISSLLLFCFCLWSPFRRACLFGCVKKSRKEKDRKEKRRKRSDQSTILSTSAHLSTHVINT